MVVTLGERLPMLALGLVLLFAPGLAPNTLLTIFFALFAIQMLSGGLIVTAWQDFVARLIPGAPLGHLFRSTAGQRRRAGRDRRGAGWHGAGARLFPQNTGLLALLCFAAMVLSYIFMLCTIEPAPAGPAARAAARVPGRRAAAAAARPPVSRLPRSAAPRSRSAWSAIAS